MKVLMVGGTGTISESIAAKLAADPDTDLTLLKRSEDRRGLPGSVKIICGDFRTEGSRIRELLQGEMYDSVMHFFIFNEEDARKSYDIFRGLTRQFIYISTNVVLDHTVSCRIDETVKKGNTLSKYGREKREAEDFLLERSGEDFPVTVVRPSHTYSRDKLPIGLHGRNTWSVISRMLAGKPVIVHGDGQGIWPHTHADDFAEWFCPLIANQDTIGEIYHIMNPKPVTWEEIYRTIAEALGVEFRPVYISTFLLEHSAYYNWHDEIHGDKYFSNIFDCSKVQAFNPDFVPKIDLKKGCEMYLDYLEKHPECKSEDPAFDEWCDRIIAKYEKLKSEFIQDI